MSLLALIALLTTHLVADWFLQSNWMAINKSKSWRALTVHVAVYTACFAWVWLVSVRSCSGQVLYVRMAPGWFLAVTFVAHFLTDAITSRMTTRLWFMPVLREEPNISALLVEYIPSRRHWFFVVIGVDQWIHQITLILTWRLLMECLW